MITHTTLNCFEICFQFFNDTDTPSLPSHPTTPGDKTKSDGTNTNSSKEIISSKIKDILAEHKDESNTGEETVDHSGEKVETAISRRGSRGSYLSSVSSSCGSCSLDASLASSSNAPRY